MGEVASTVNRLRLGSDVFLVLAVGAAGISFIAGTSLSRQMLVTTAVALSTIFVSLHLLSLLLAHLSRRRLRIVMDFLEHDSAPGFCTDVNGSVFAQNPAAVDRFGAQDGMTMTHALGSLFANPDAVVHRLRSAAQGRRTAREDVVTRSGHVRVSIHRISGGLLWRLEDMVDRTPRAADGIGLPVLTFGPSGTILYMNDILRATTGRRVKRMRDLFEEVPLQSGGLNRLLTKSGPRPVRVVLSEPLNGRQEVFVMPAGENVDGRVALDALPVALLRLDAEGRIVFANRLARELLPTAGQGGETRLAALVEGLGRSVREWVSEAAMGRGLYRAEVVRVTVAEAETYLQIMLGRPLDDADGGLLAVLNDATELKTLEAQFVQSQKMQAIGQLAGGVAHDFNNLLTAISGHCDLLLLRHDETDDDFADLTQITQNANRAAALVGQLLAFSRKQTLQMQPVDLRDTLGDLAHLLNRLVGERVSLRLQHDPALIPIRGDRRQLEQVLMNLVVNARDAMPEGGEILIETHCRFLDAPMSRDRVTLPAGQYVVVEVTDQGVGISPDNLVRIFEPFFTTKRPGEGTGLGLSMAYGIMKQSGGYIFADSTMGRGTRFSLYFPAMAIEEEERADETSVPVAQMPGIHGSSPDLVEIAPDFAAAADGAGAELAAGDGNALDGLFRSMIEEFNGAERPAETQRVDVGPDAIASETIRGSESSCEEPPDAVDDCLATAAAQETAHPREAGRRPEVTGSDDPDRPKDGDGAPRERFGRPVVLLVEDEAPVRAFASRALRLRGYDVVEADSAEAALLQLEDETLAIDLFVTDVMMPGLDGPTWVREALKTRPDVPTIFISGYTQDALSETSVPVPNAVFLAKPFSLSDLTRTVERALQ